MPVATHAAGHELSRPQDCSRINIDQPHEVSYWTRRWDVTPAQLREAIERVGPGAAAVAQALGKPADSAADSAVDSAADPSANPASAAVAARVVAGEPA